VGIAFNVRARGVICARLRGEDEIRRQNQPANTRDRCEARLAAGERAEIKPRASMAMFSEEGAKWVARCPKRVSTMAFPDRS